MAFVIKCCIYSNCCNISVSLHTQNKNSNERNSKHILKWLCAEVLCFMWAACNVWSYFDWKQACIGSESRHLADWCSVFTRSAKEMIRTVVGMWLVSVPSPRYCAHGTGGPEIVSQKQLPFSSAHPHPPASLLCLGQTSSCFWIWQLVVKHFGLNWWQQYSRGK